MTEILEDFLDRLEAAGLEYMLVGSVASGLYGMARTTQDVDVVVETGMAGLERLLASLPQERYYFSPAAAREALLRTASFNVIEVAGGAKVDVLFRKRRPFSQSEFERRQEIDYGGRRRWAATKEDIILAKLEWDRISPSERQRRDVLGIIQVQRPDLDLAYLRYWAAELGVAQPLEELLAL